MKERTFYTINLDTKRIIILFCLFILMAALIFYVGMSFGKRQSVVHEVKTNMGGALEENKVNPNEKAPIKMEDEIVKRVNKSNPKDNTEIIDLTHNKKPSAANEEDITVLDDKEVLNDTENSSNKKRVSKQHRQYTKKRFTIQFGAFSSKEKANVLKERISQIDPKINPYIQKNGNLYTVRAGMTNNKSELKKMIQVLEPELKDKAIIVRVPRSYTYQK